MNRAIWVKASLSLTLSATSNATSNLALPESSPFQGFEDCMEFLTGVGLVHKCYQA
jgi:hypothetical protein